MEPLLLVIDFSNASWLAIAFITGFAASRAGLPPLVGFLLAGFFLNYLGAESNEFLNNMADLGVTLLLFTIGLKLRVSTLLKPEIWGIATLHMGITVLALGTFVIGLGITGVSMFTSLDFTNAIIIGFALSFSSTVFAVKALDSSGEMYSRFGRIAIGILIMQDIAAVVFLAISSGKLPSLWALLLVGLIVLRKPLLAIINRAGHGELLILMGFTLAIGGAQLFELFNLKGDLGALFLGAVLAGHPRTEELATNLLGFKELFLVGFFLNIGLTGIPTLEMFFASVLLLLLVAFKMVLFLWMFTRFRLMAITAHRATITLASYSEFGLIVAAVAVNVGWLSTDWLLVIAVAVSLSFISAAILNMRANLLFNSFKRHLKMLEKPDRVPEDAPIDFRNAETIIFGMGRVGTCAYEVLTEMPNDSILGVDFDEKIVKEHIKAGRNVVAGDATNPEFWERVCHADQIKHVLLVMPEHNAQLSAIEQTRKQGYKGKIAASAKFPDEVDALKKLGVEAAFNIYAEAGSGFAEHVRSQFKL